MDQLSRPMHQRAAVVAIAGAVIGMLAQGSLTDPSVRSSKPSSPRAPGAPHLTVSNDIGDACGTYLATCGREQFCGAVVSNLLLAVADRELSATPNN